MRDEHVVVIGGGHAAAQLVASLRQEGWKGRISLVSADLTIPYHRPPLSKSYLSGTQSADQILIRPASFYAEANVDVLLGSSATSIDRSAKTITLDDGATLAYDKLALTTGASVRKLSIAGDHLDGVLYLRDVCDVDRIRRFVGPGKHAVLIGGGYVGLETAASLRKLGMSVTVLEALPRVLQRVTAPQVSEFYTRVHGEEGVKIIAGCSPEAIVGRDQVQSVKLTDGQSLPADLVIIGIGVIPETSLALNAGLEVESGVLVDEYARTSDHNIVAAGDCTNHVSSLYQRSIRLESVQNATDQAKIAAKTLCGQFVAYSALPWFWSDQYDVKLQIAGLSQNYDQVVIRGDHLVGRSFSAFYFSKGKFLAVDAINSPKAFMLARRALSAGKAVDPVHLSDETMTIEEVLKVQ